MVFHHLISFLPFTAYIYFLFGGIFLCIDDWFIKFFYLQYDDGKMAGMQLTNDYKGQDFTASLTLGQIDIVRNSGIVVGQYLQSVTKSLALGAELMCQKGGQIPGGQISMLSLGGKFTGNFMRFFLLCI